MSEAGARRRRSTLAFGALVFIGTFILQSAWILATPPFRGIDEFDHVYRASGVAHGQWRLPERADNARGHEVAVPRHIVGAASAQCDVLPYTDPGNCFPIKELGNGLVTVATAAGGYNPLYYAIIGYPTKDMEGASADLGMRSLSASLCALGIAVAAVGLRMAGVGGWGQLGLLVSLTPMFVYSSIVPAPNGAEMVAGLCLWGALLALCREGAPRQVRVAWFGMGTVAASTLAMLRTLGPLWLAMILVSVIAWVGLRRTASVLRSLPRWWVGACGLVVVGANGVAAWWTVSAGLAEPSTDLEDATRSGSAGAVNWISRMVVWTVQLVGAFPYRDQPAPTGVYALYFAVVVTLLSLALKRGNGHERLLILGLCAVTLLLPVGLTMATSETQGVIWQGRYALPFVVGIPLLAGAVADRHEMKSRRGTVFRMVGLGMLGLAQVWSVVDVLVDEKREPVASADPVWINPPTAAISVWACVGVAILVVALFRTGDASTTRRGVTSTPLSKPVRQ
jgi:hypothetical protein